MPRSPAPAFGWAILALSLTGCEPPDVGPAAATPPAEAPPEAPAPVAPVADAQGVRTGQQAPTLSLSPVGGGAPWTLAAHLHPAGEPGPHAVLVAIMASWCGYCTKSLPTLKALQDEFSDLLIVTVTIDDSPEKQHVEEEKVRAAGLTGPVLVADEPTRQVWMGASGTVPRYVFVNAEGRITNQDKGFGAKVQPMMAGQARRALGLKRSAP